MCAWRCSATCSVLLELWQRPIRHTRLPMLPELAPVSAQLVGTIDGVEGLAEVAGERVGGGNDLEGPVGPDVAAGRRSLDLHAGARLWGAENPVTAVDVVSSAGPGKVGFG